MKRPTFTTRPEHVPDHTTNGIRLRNWREHHGKTLAEVAGALGLSVSMISQMETGNRQTTPERFEQFINAVSQTKP